MKVILYLRRDKARAGVVNMRVDFNHERDDTPRINNLGLEIAERLQESINSCSSAGRVSGVKGSESHGDPRPSDGGDGADESKGGGDADDQQ